MLILSLDPLGSYVCSQPTLGNQGKDSSYWPGLNTGNLVFPQGVGSTTPEGDDREGWFPEENVGSCWSKRGMIPANNSNRSHFPAFQRLSLYCLLELEAISMLSYCWLFFPVSLCAGRGLIQLTAQHFLPWSLPSTSQMSASRLPWSHIQRGFQIVYLLALIFVTHVCLWFLMLVLNYPPVRLTFTSNSRYTRSISSSMELTRFPQPSRWRCQGSTMLQLSP